MKSKLFLRKNRKGDQFLSINLFDKEIFIFPNEMISDLLNFNKPVVDFFASRHGNICLSKNDLLGNGVLYSKIGTWNRLDEDFILLFIDGKGMYKIELKINIDILVVEIQNSNDSKNKFSLNVIDHLKSKVFNPENY